MNNPIIKLWVKNM